MSEKRPKRASADGERTVIDYKFISAATFEDRFSSVQPTPRRRRSRVQEEGSTAGHSADCVPPRT